MKLWDDVVDMNEDILEMSDDAIWKNERIRQSMNLDVTGLKSGKGINFDRYKNLSKKSLWLKLKTWPLKIVFIRQNIVSRLLVKNYQQVFEESSSGIR